MDWFVACLGEAKGRVSAGDRWLRLSPAFKSSIPLARPPRPDVPVTFRSERGKLGDSQDSLLFLGTKVDPSTTDFSLSATFEVLSSAGAGRQAGYGLVALDALVPGDKRARHRNMLAAGYFRMRRFDEYEHGVRVVAGHTSQDACEHTQARRLDPTRVFAALPATGLPAEHERHRLRLEKTGEGISCEIDGGGIGRRGSVRGGDFLTVQDPAVYVGVFVAGAIEVTVSDLMVKTDAGSLGQTPEGEICHMSPDYPFPRKLVQVPCPSPCQTLSLDVVHVAPHGTPKGEGTPESPLDIQTASLVARGGSKVLVADGTYRPLSPIVLPSRGNAPVTVRIEAEHAGKALIDGSDLKERVPIMTVLGNGWHLRGMTFQNGPSAGLLVCGSDNVVDCCEAHHNADTGILICAFPGMGREGWPSRNLVCNCRSHDNCDTARANADGFGAKLSVGDGNRFYRCVAHHNIDDGFDLYAKGVLGPIGAVRLDECVAYENGHLSDEGPRRKRKCGTGFKLGGENLEVVHVATNCVAYGNDQAGFSSNSNPAGRLCHVTAWDNGRIRWVDDIRLYTARKDIDPSWVVSDAIIGHRKLGMSRLERLFESPSKCDASTERASQLSRERLATSWTEVIQCLTRPWHKR